MCRLTNGIYDVEFDENGEMNRLTFTNDAERMNFVKSGYSFGLLVSLWKNRQFVSERFESVQYEAKEGAVFAEWSKGKLALYGVYRFDGDCFKVNYTLKNGNDYPVYFKDGDVKFEMPFNDHYSGSDVCMKAACHTHVWAGNDYSYIRAERMGESEYNLGLVFHRGDIQSYSQNDCKANDRGCFLLNVSAFSLLHGESKEFEYTVFCYDNVNHFEDVALRTQDYVQVIAKNGYTFSKGQKACFELCTDASLTSVFVGSNGKKATYKIKDNKIIIVPDCSRLGEHIVEYVINGKKGKFIYYVGASYATLIRKRIEFIVEKQQCLDVRSPLYGAYLIYDNAEKMQYYNHDWKDLNASRERFGMAILIAKYLQTNPDKKVFASLKLFLDFLIRECFDENTGEVFDDIFKQTDYVRLYNIPWVALFFAEYYKLTKNERYARYMMKAVRFYYTESEGSGVRFYPNGIRMSDFYNVACQAGLKDEFADVVERFKIHAENILSTGTHYPPHEVNFEQTIVAPAATLLLDAYEIFDDEKYLENAKLHLKILKKFDGNQPDHRLNKIPIRYWDDFWFGKSNLYGDTFPHYWSVLSGFCHCIYAKAVQDENAFEYGKQCIENCTCLFNENGEASCAYVYPNTLNGSRGECFDAFANDQDFALYFLMRVQELDAKNK